MKKQELIKLIEKQNTEIKNLKADIDWAIWQLSLITEMKIFKKGLSDSGIDEKLFRNLKKLEREYLKKHINRS